MVWHMSKKEVNLPTAWVLGLYRPTSANMARHYSNPDVILNELDSLKDIVFSSNDCNLGAEFIMCLDEFWGAEFGGSVSQAVDNLRSEKFGRVYWFGPRF